MKKTSKRSGAKDAADKYFDKHYRDKNGNVLWDKIREVLKDVPPIPPDEWQRMLREGPKPRPPKEDEGAGQAA